MKMGRPAKHRSRSDFKLLPPGTFTDYLRLWNARLPSDCQITCQMFCIVWRESFAHRMGIRPKRQQHATCSICLKHKMIIKCLADDHRATKCQMDGYQQRLQCNTATVSFIGRAGLLQLWVSNILRGHSKFKHLKSAVFASGDFAKLNRRYPCKTLYHVCIKLCMHACMNVCVCTNACARVKTHSSSNGNGTKMTR